MGHRSFEQPAASGCRTVHVKGREGADLLSFVCIYGFRHLHHLDLRDRQRNRQHSPVMGRRLQHQQCHSWPYVSRLGQQHWR